LLGFIELFAEVLEAVRVFHLPTQITRLKQQIPPLEIERTIVAVPNCVKKWIRVLRLCIG
jgi:hypothetical protein